MAAALRPPRRLARLAAVTLVALVAAGPLLLAGSAAATASAPAQSGSPFPLPCTVQTRTGSVAIVYYLQILVGPVNLCPGQLFFGDQLYIQFTNTLGNRTVEVTSVQSGSPTLVFNESFDVPGQTTSILGFLLPSSLQARSTTLCMDGTCMTFPHETPFTLFPSGVLTVGGIDVLLFMMCILLGFAIIPVLLVARYLTHRALWSPHAYAWLWGPHIVAGFLLLLVVDYQAFDSIFHGWGVFLFPTVLVVIIFYETLPLFNTVDPSLVLQADPKGGHRLDWRYDVLLVAEVDVQGGTKHVVILPGWLMWLARIRGFFPVVSSPTSWDSAQGPPEEMKLVAQRLQVVKRRFRASPGRNDPMESFRLMANRRLRKRYKFRWLYFVDSDNYLELTRPRVAWHRDVEVTVRTVGTDGEIREVVERHPRLSLPHFVAPPESAMGLSGVHIVDTMSQSLGYVERERTNRRMQMLRRQVGLFQQTLYDRADQMADAQMEEFLRGFERAEERDELSDEQADAETVREAPKALPTATPRTGEHPAPGRESVPSPQMRRTPAGGRP